MPPWLRPQSGPHTSKSVQAHMHACTTERTFAGTHTCHARPKAHTHDRAKFMHAHMQACTHACMHARTHARTHACMWNQCVVAAMPYHAMPRHRHRHCHHATMPPCHHAIGHPAIRPSGHAITMRCSAMQCDAVRCSAMQCDAVRCDAMRCDAMQSPCNRHVIAMPSRYRHCQPQVWSQEVSLVPAHPHH